MKKSLLALIFVFIQIILIGQSALPEYQDGKIWFQLRSDVRINASLTEDPYHLQVSSLPFLIPISKSYSINNLSRPFFAAKTSSTLQRTYLLQFSDFTSVQLIIDQLKASGKVVYAERVPMDRTCLIPNDPSFGSQWHLATINAASAWNSFSVGSNIKIAVIDNAVDRAHQDLVGNLWINAGEIPSNGVDDDGNGFIDDVNGFDVSDNDNNPNPPSNSFNHGTHCAGIADATTNNAIGIASIGYSCKLIGIKATSNSASPSSITNGYDGVVYAIAAGAEVISMSWGSSATSNTAQNIITWASQNGAVLIAAAGNNNVSTLFYPAGYVECIAVAATSSNDAKASFSNFGSWVDISAPGNNIYSTRPSNSYGNMSGTSMACPLVAGLAGLMLSLNPYLTPTDVRNCIVNNAVNINAQNASYIGQLGGGRINADASMLCVNTILNNLPIADFFANVTTVSAGGQIQYTNTSLYCFPGSTYSWVFAGGTPATSTLQTPPTITYNTTGIYNATLTVTNSNGSNTKLETNYITVTPASNCIKVNLPAPPSWNPVNYYTGSPAVGQDGWINGVNNYNNKQKAMYFDQSSQANTILNNVYVAFGLAYTSNPAKIVPLHIYDGTTGVPTTLLGTANLPMSQIMANVVGNYFTEYSFLNNPITLPASKKFFVSVDLVNLNWATDHDTLSIVSNTNLETTAPLPTWEKQSNNLWYQYATPGSWNLYCSLYIHPFLTNVNSVATFTQSATSICQGDQIIFDALGSTFDDTLLWYFPGGSPVISNTILQSVLYNVPGNYNAILYVVGGGCSLFDSASVAITVNPNPVLAISATSTTICSPNSTTLTASGANTYLWSPPTSLSSTNTASTVATPTSTITYNVLGTTTATGCFSNTSIQIDVFSNPVAIQTVNDTVICMTESVVFDGSTSIGVTSFAWSFPGGIPATSNASSVTVNYPSAGNFTASLVVSNLCGSDAVSSQTIGVGCIGIDQDEIAAASLFFNANQQELNMTFPQANTSYTVLIFDHLGKVLKSLETNKETLQLGVADLAAGIYFVQIYNEDYHFISKFLKQ